MIQKINPDYEIKIGIKNGDVVGVNWEEMFDHENYESPADIVVAVDHYLHKALQFCTRKNI